MSEPLFYRSGSNWTEWDLKKYALERGHKLPEDESKWPQAITNHVATTIPFLSKYPTEIAIDDKDVKLGYAKGRLVVGGGKITVPLIIKEAKLMPLDVFIHEDTFLPLEEKSIETVMMDKSMGVKPVSRKEYKGENTNLERSSTPPRSAYTHGNAGYKVGHVLDSISVIHSEDIQDFKDKLAEDRSLAIEFYHKFPDFVKKLASINSQPRDFTDSRSLEEKVRDVSVNEGWPCNVIQLHKIASHTGSKEFTKVAMYSSSDYYPMAYTYKEVDVSEIRNAFGQEILEKLAAGNPHTIVMGRSGFTYNTPSEMQFPIEPMEKFGQYDAVSQNNRVVRGFFIPEVFDYGMNKIANMKLFTSKDCFAMQEKIAGRRVSAGPRAELPAADIREGITGTFVFRFGEKTAALEPFRVSSFPLESGEQVSFDAFSTRGEAMHFTVMNGLAAATPGEKRGHYLIPSFWQFVRVGDFSEPMLAEQGDMPKYAQASKKLELMWDGVDYTIRGEQVENISQQLFDLDAMRARFFLTAFGVSPNYADELLRKAKSAGYVEFEATVKPTGNYEVITNAIRHMDGSVDTKYAASTVELIDAVVDQIRSNSHIKEAILADEPETVDKVLSLNFVNRQNVAEFTDSIDEFRDAQTKLARLLVAARLGVQQVDPETIKTAMENLSEVIEGLEVLRTVMRAKKR